MQQIQFFIIDQAYTTQKHRIQPLVASVFHLELSCSDSSLNVCGSFIHLMIYKICCNLKYTKKCELESLLLGKTKWNWISVSYIGSLQYCAHWHSEAIHRFLHYLTIPACACKSIFFFYSIWMSSPAVCTEGDLHRCLSSSYQNQQSNT